MSPFTFARIAGLALLGTALIPNVAAAADFVDILPDASLKGWTRIPIPPIDGLKPKLQWRVDAAQKALICSGDGGHEWLRYDQELGDYILQVEWRFTPKTEEPKKYNSGVGVRLSKFGELWVQAQTGLAGGYLFGENLSDGAIKRFNLSKEMKENRVKPAGEWNVFEVRSEGPKMTVWVNGGITAEKADLKALKGYAGLEAEGYRIEFRNVKLKELK